MASVLYVEDEENDVFFMRRSFQRAGLNQSLKVVIDGQEAIDYLSGRGRFGNRTEYPLPTVVLLDLNLPTVSGFQVLTWIRTQPQFRQLPVVIFSSSARPEDKSRAKELGADDYLEKPGSGLEFGIALQALNQKWIAPALDSRTAASQPRLAAGKPT
jgi:CheY-like chemotaxis protein